MSTSGDIVIVRSRNNVACEVRVIHALHSQHSLEQLEREPLFHVSVDASSKVPTTYQNTGVQTLPPADGDSFKIIHGREPSHIECAYGTGSAGIGRLSDDPRLNPYELMYGSAYPAPMATNIGIYTDSGFQTMTHDISRKALARAKVKASVTANQYCDAASQAGYIACAEARNEMVVHSEQFFRAVQLDAEGNLLEGTVQNRRLPNISGISVLPAIDIAQSAAGHDKGCLSQYREAGEQIEHAQHSSPVQSHLKALKSHEWLQKPAASIPALAPASAPQTCNLERTIDNEYGTVEPDMNNYVIYDPDAPLSRPLSGSREAVSPSTKHRTTGDRPSTSPMKVFKKSELILARRSSHAIEIPFVTSPDRFHRNHKILVSPDVDWTANSELAEAQPTRSGEDDKSHRLNSVWDGIKRKLGSEEDVSDATNEPETQGDRVRRKLPVFDFIVAKASSNQTDHIALSRTNDDGHRNQHVKQPLSSHRNWTSSSCPTLSASTKNDGNVTYEGNTSLRMDQAFDQTSPKSDNRISDLKRLKVSPSTCNEDLTKQEEQGCSLAEQRMIPVIRTKPTQNPSKESRASTPGNTHQPSTIFPQREPVSRQSRTPRQPMAPYVPPAMRTRFQKSSKVIKKG